MRDFEQTDHIKVRRMRMDDVRPNDTSRSREARDRSVSRRAARILKIQSRSTELPSPRY